MSKEIIPLQRVAHSIRYVRRQKVLLDFDLAELYGVATKALNQAVKRNVARFPADFMFQLNAAETASLRSQNVISTGQTLQGQALATNRSQSVTGSLKHRERRSRPYAFTEQGVAMLSSVLNSERAVKVNIAIMRAFVRLREALDTNRELARKFAELEQHVGKHDEEISAIIEAIRQLMAPARKPAREIGFHVRERSPRYRTRNGR
jgi:phage regulator Rha-like protein